MTSRMSTVLCSHENKYCDKDEASLLFQESSKLEKKKTRPDELALSCLLVVHVTS